MEPADFAGKYIQVPREVPCDNCGEVQPVMVPIKIDRVEGDKGYGPGGALMSVCRKCGHWFEVTWDNAVVQID